MRGGSHLIRAIPLVQCNVDANGVGLPQIVLKLPIMREEAGEERGGRPLSFGGRPTRERDETLSITHERVATGAGY